MKRMRTKKMATKKFIWSGYVADPSFFFDETDEDIINSNSAKKVIDYLEEDKSNEAYITVSSGGGDAFVGAEVVSMLEPYRSRIKMEALGLVASAASIIAVAGSDKLYARLSSVVMIHEAIRFTIGGVAEHTSSIKVLNIINDNAAKVYSERSELSLQEAKDAMAETTWYSAEQAKEVGLVQEVLKPNEAISDDSVQQMYKTMRKAYNKMSKHHTNQIREDSILMRVQSAPVNSHSEEETMEEETTAVAGSTGGETTPATPAAIVTATDPVIVVEPDVVVEVAEGEAALRLQNKQFRAVHVALKEENKELRKQLKYVGQSSESKLNREALNIALETGRITPIDEKKWEARLSEGGKMMRDVLLERPSSDYFVENGIAHDPTSIDSVPVGIRTSLKKQGYTDEQIVKVAEQEGLR